jgi:ribosomal protein S19
VGLTFDIYNGKKYIEVTVTEDMVGHKFGEFSLTRAKFSFKKKKLKK